MIKKIKAQHAENVVTNKIYKILSKQRIAEESKKPPVAQKQPMTKKELSLSINAKPFNIVTP
jgi:hypothetical protein